MRAPCCRAIQRIKACASEDGHLPLDLCRSQALLIPAAVSGRTHRRFRRQGISGWGGGGFPGVLTYLSDLLAYLCRPIHPGSAAPKGMAMPFATVFSRGHQFSQDHGGGAAERSRVAERSAATACCRYNLLWGSGRRIWCACRGTLPCFFSRSERAAGLQ